MKRLFLILASLFSWIIPSFGSPVEWPKGDIEASLRSNPAVRIGQFLQLDRDLGNAYGWKQMRIDLPDTWAVTSVKVEESGFAVLLNDQRVYRVSRDKIGDLSFRILDGGRKSETELQALWRPYESKG